MTMRRAGAVFVALLAYGGRTATSQVAPASGPVVVAVNQRTQAATIVEANSGRVVATVPLGIEPHEATASPNGRTVAIAGLNDGMRRNRRLLLLDVASRELRRIELGTLRGPHGVAFLSDSVVLVSAMFDTSIAYVDVPSGRVLRVVGGIPEEPYLLKIAARTNRAFVSSPHSSIVTEIDVTAGRKLRAFSIPDDPAGIAVSSDGTELWAAVWRQAVGGAVAVVDIASGAVAARLDGFQQPRRLTFTADGRRVAVTDQNHLRIVDRANRRLLASVPLGDNAGGSGVSCTPDSTRCWVGLSSTGEIVEVDVVNFRIVRRIANSRGVDGIIYVTR
jgi:YD repeat-containing protein